MEGKKNYCTDKGECTLPSGTPVRECEHCRARIMSHGCSYYVWPEEKCLSPFALTAARGEAGPEMPPEFMETAEAAS